MARSAPALVFIFITLFLAVFGVGVALPVFPRLVEQLRGWSVGTAALSMGWLGALYSIMQFLVSPLIGSLSDRYGRRPVILISLLGAGVDYLVLAWAPTIGWLYLARAVSGLTAANTTAANAYLADVTPPEKRAAAFATIGAAIGLGLIMGPAVGGLLAGYGLRTPFVVAGGITLLNWLYGALVLPESLKPEDRRALRWERVQPFKALADLRRWPQVAWLAGSMFLYVLANNVYAYLWVLYTGTRYGWDSKQVGLSVALVGVTVSLVQGGGSGKILAAIGERRGVYLGLLIAATAMCLYGAATTGWMFCLIIPLGALGTIASPTIKALISQAVPRDEQGALQGTLSSIASIADIAAPPLWTLLFSWSLAPSRTLCVPGLAFYAAGAVLLLAFALAWGAFRRAGS